MTMNYKTMQAALQRGGLVLTSLAAATVLSSCSDRPPTGVYGETTKLLQQVRADLKALNMSPGDSRKLAVTAYDAGASVMTDPVAVRYTSSSLTRVKVDDDGTVHALALTEEPVSVIIAGTVGQVTQFDTVFVNVLASPAAPPERLVMYFDGDSLGLGAGGSNFMNGALITAAGDTLWDMLVVFTTKDQRVAKPSRYQRWTWIQGVAPGKTWVYGTATLGNKTFSDSLYVHVGWAAEAYIGWNYAGRWGNGTLQVVVQPGGVVYWYNWNSDDASAVTFDDPSAAEAESPGGPSGNIAAFHGATNPRRFTKVGTYTWHSTDNKGNPQTGQVIVKPNPE
jgi:hypothetical protein